MFLDVKPLAGALLPALLVMAQSASAQQAAPADVVLPAVEVRSILPDRLESVPGSFTVVDDEELASRRPFSLQEALSGVTGVHVVGEDTFGLGHNIGIRGLDPRRSSRTLLLEDGMPLFLAPYGDPSAHYSTPLDRVMRIEVVKGSGQVLHGPQTIGGMINFVTRPVPTDGVRGSAEASLGNNGFRGLHANLGVGGERGGIMLDAIHKGGDGVRANHDFDIREFALKGQLRLTGNQTLIAKVSHYEEDSNVSETGLGAVEFQEDRFQAPTGKNDVFRHERTSMQLQHIVDLSDRATLTTQLYRVESDRASFRQINEPGGNDGRSQLERCPPGIDRNDFGNAGLCGGRWRPRDYEYWGFEPRLDLKHQLFGVGNAAVVGLRYHAEDIVRRQFRGDTAAYQSLAFARSAGLPREHIDIDVKAMSYYAQNTSYVGNWSVTPGVRIEDLRIDTDVIRADGEGHDNAESRLVNRQTKVLPGFGVAWHGIANTTLIAGVHRGFAPPRPDRDIFAEDGENTAVVSRTEPEESTNWELGVRSSYFRGVNLEATLFRTDFKEIVINGPTPGTFVNGGESRQSGFELGGRVDFGDIFNTPHNVYLSGAYTNLFRARFETDVPDEEIVSGNRMPYAPRHMLSLSLGYAHPAGLDARIGVDYISRQFSDGANTSEENLSGEEGIIPSFALLNASVGYSPRGSSYTLFLSGHNLADRDYLVSRVDGKVAGRGRQVFGGIRVRF